MSRFDRLEERLAALPQRVDGGQAQPSALEGIESVEFRLPTGQPYRLVKPPAGADGYRSGVALNGAQDADWKVCMSLLEADTGVFLDLGANIGTYAVPAAVMGRTVHAFELLPENVERLLESVEANGLANVNVMLGAVWSHPAIVAFGGFSAWGQVTKTSNTRIATVAVDDYVDDYVDEVAVARVGVVKLDVEGAEKEALQGMRRLIERDAPDILFEANALTCGGAGYSYRDLLKAVAGSAYTIYRITDHGLAPLHADAVQEIVKVDYLATRKTADQLTAVTGLPIMPMSPGDVAASILGEDRYNDFHRMHVLAVFDHLPATIRSDARVSSMIQAWAPLRSLPAMRQLQVGAG